MIRDHSNGETFSFNFNGTLVSAHPGDTIAAALLANGINTTRITSKGLPRGPFCMMGACYDCLIELNGVTLQSCMTMAVADMEVVSAVPVTSVESHTSVER